MATSKELKKQYDELLKQTRPIQNKIQHLIILLDHLNEIKGVKELSASDIAMYKEQHGIKPYETEEYIRKQLAAARESLNQFQPMLQQSQEELKIAEAEEQKAATTPPAGYDSRNDIVSSIGMSQNQYEAKVRKGELQDINAKKATKENEIKIINDKISKIEATPGMREGMFGNIVTNELADRKAELAIRQKELADINKQIATITGAPVAGAAGTTEVPGVTGTPGAGTPGAGTPGDPYSMVWEYLNKMTGGAEEERAMGEKAIRGEWEQVWPEMQSMIESEAVKYGNLPGEKGGYYTSLAKAKATGELGVIKSLSDLNLNLRQMGQQAYKDAATMAISLYGTEEQKKQFAAQLGEHVRQFDINATLKESEIATAKEQWSKTFGLEQQRFGQDILKDLYAREDTEWAKQQAEENARLEAENFEKVGDAMRRGQEQGFITDLLKLGIRFGTRGKSGLATAAISPRSTPYSSSEYDYNPYG